MLPYDGMTRTGSKGVSHSALSYSDTGGDPQLEWRKVKQR